MPGIVPIVTLMALAAGAPGVAPESPRITFEGERLLVRLVEVDLWAEDDHGNAVNDLQRDDLLLEVDSRETPITHFHAWSAAAAVGQAVASAVATARDAERGKDDGTTIAVLFDDASLDPGHRQRVGQALATWLAKEAPENLWFTVDLHDRSLLPLVPRTRNHRVVRRALEDLPLNSAFASQRALREQRVIEEIHEFQRLAFTGPQNFEPPCSRSFLRLADSFADEVESESRATLWSVGRLSEQLAAVPGRKFLVFVTEGVPLRPGAAVYDFLRALCDGSGAREGLQWAIDVTAGSDISGELPKAKNPAQLDAPALAFAGGNRDLSRQLESVAALANSHRVTIWPVSARGLRTLGAGAIAGSRTSTTFSLLNQHAEANDALSAFAAATGGEEIADRNDFVEAFADRFDDLDAGYTLAFDAPDDDERTNHRILVRTTRPGVRLRYRRSWRSSSPEEILAASVRSAAMLSLEQQAMGAQLSLVEQRASSDGGRRVLIRLRIPLDRVTLLPDSGGRRFGRLDIAVALVHSLGADAIEVRSRELPISVDSVEAEKRDSLVHDFDVPLDAGGGTTFVVGVRDELSRELALLRIEVPAL